MRFAERLTTTTAANSSNNNNNNRDKDKEKDNNNPGNSHCEEFTRIVSVHRETET